MDLSESDKRRMPKAKTDLPRGTLDLLILKALSLEPLHGVGISRRISQMTNGAFQVSFGSLFPSLHRMEESEWVAAEWRASENNRRASTTSSPPWAEGARPSKSGTGTVSWR